MATDFCLDLVRLRKRLEELLDNAVVMRPFHSTSLEDNVRLIKLLKLKKLTYQALRQYEQHPEFLESETVDWLEELSLQIVKMITIQKAKEFLYISKRIVRTSSDSESDNLNERLWLEKLQILSRYQHKIIKMTRQEMMICSETRKAILELQNEESEYRKAYQERLSEQECTTPKEHQSNHRQIEKINIMRKLMIAILLTKDLCTKNNKYHDLFITLRNPVTVETFMD